MKTFFPHLRQLQYPLIRMAIFLIRKMPYRMAIAISRFLGALGWALDPLHRKIADIQMRHALGDSYNPLVTLKVFMNHGDILVDTIHYAYMDKQEITDKIIIDGRENLEAALALNKGVMMITGHIGNWEILAHTSRLLDIEFCVMADVRNDPGLEAIINDIRARSGATILPPKGKALMLIKELKKGRSIGFVIDQRGKRGNKLLCDFFGLPAPTNPAPAFIALKGDAVIIPVYTIKNKNIYTIYFDRPVEARSFGTGELAIKKISDFMQTWVELVVRRHPDQWFWLHSRWTRRSDMRHLIRSRENFREYIISQTREIEEDMNS